LHHPAWRGQPGSLAPVVRTGGGTRAARAFGAGIARSAGGQRNRRQGGGAGVAGRELPALRGGRGSAAGGGKAVAQARLKAVAQARLKAQPQTFLIAPSIRVRVVLMESSTPVKIGGWRRNRRQFSLRRMR